MCLWAAHGAAASAQGTPGASIVQPANNTALVAQVRARLVNAPVIHGNFEQKKTIQGFRNPLVSTGTFLIAQGKGVSWHTRKPFESVLTITRERMLSRQADGQISTRVEASDEPGLRAVNEMLFAVMAADLRTLEQRFAISGELRGKQGWWLQLTPRDSMLAQWITRISLSGDSVVRSVTLMEAHGDSSVITFTDTVTAQSLNAEDVRRFE
ncbi:outer membrane lipoprotein carrier protein LolA [Imbroritus primus]|uniref:Outer membrane lipoprotein carrier protein LolA n=2 Tax=Imbroritus primus TaxID=3058603 RepID=A0ACD3SUN1_9BURK|nr:outer membrane lipoprotein carrier protein LolA [Burkholderiaceae bacterium PBA]